MAASSASEKGAISELPLRRLAMKARAKERSDRVRPVAYVAVFVAARGGIGAGGVAGLRAEESREARTPTPALDGRVVTLEGAGVPGADLRAGSMRTTTGPDGSFQLASSDRCADVGDCEAPRFPAARSRCRARGFSQS